VTTQLQLIIIIIIIIVIITLQRHINEFYSKICQHHIICSIHIVLFIDANIYFKYCVLKFYA